MIRKVLKQHGHHAIFGMSTLSLALLVAWWSVFINRSIEERRTLYMENLESSLTNFSMQLGHAKDKPPQPGVFREDNRFEIAAYDSAADRLAKPLLPLWPGWCLKVKKTVLEALQKDFKRKKTMVVGESGLLVLLILLSSILLYQFIQAEKRSTREMEEFWGRVTHEIKTPIAGIKAFLQSLKNQALEPGRMPPFVDMALAQVEKQERLAENILAGYGLHSRDTNLKLNLQDLDLGKYINDYFQHHVLHLTDARLEIIPGHSPGQNPIVRADSQLLRVILDNLVDNAMKYCSPGLVLKVCIFKQNKCAVISVNDNGPGIPTDFSEKIFEAYKFLAEELPGTRHGSGMGLDISRRLAKKMNGRLKVSPQKKGNGAEFRLYLPLAKSPGLPTRSTRKP